MKCTRYLRTFFQQDPLAPLLQERLALIAPIIGGGAHQMSRRYQVPYFMALMALLTAASTGVQSLIDVRTPDGRRGPVSLAILLLAKSGERKTTALKCAMKTVDAFEDVLVKLYDTARSEYEEALNIWKDEARYLRSEIGRARRAGESTSLQEDDLAEHQKRKPIAPVHTSLVYQDCSPMAMIEGLERSGMAALISSEGGAMLNGKAFESVPLLNSAHSGESFPVARSRKPPMRVRNPRLTLCIMVQPQVFGAIPEKRRDLVRGSGLWARCMVFEPESKQGTRFSGNAVDASDRIDAFHDRMVEVLELLHTRILSGIKERDAVEFSPDAQHLFIEYSNYVEREIAPGGRYTDAGDHASKLAENAARLAALLHFFEGCEGGVSIDLLKVAIEVVDTASLDFAKVFIRDPEHVSDGKLLLDMMMRYREKGRYKIERSRAMNSAPYRMRARDRFYAALQYLYATRQICVWVEADGKTYIALWDDAPPAATSTIISAMTMTN